MRKSNRALAAVSIGVLAGFAVLITLALATGIPIEPGYVSLLGGVGAIFISIFASNAVRRPCACKQDAQGKA